MAGIDADDIEFSPAIPSWSWSERCMDELGMPDLRRDRHLLGGVVFFPRTTCVRWACQVCQETGLKERQRSDIFFKGPTPTDVVSNLSSL